MTPGDEVDADAKIAALEDLRDELQENPVKDTRLAGLYEEVTTAPPQLWNRATAFIDCEVVRNDLDDANGDAASSEDDRREASNTANGDAVSSEPTSDANDLDEASGEEESDVRARAVVTDVSKLARGWWAPEIVEDCDAMVTVDVHADLPLEAFVSVATEELEESIESIRTDDEDDGRSPL